MSATALDRMLDGGPAESPGRRWIETHGWPQSRDEAWRYAPLGAITAALDAAEPQASSVALEELLAELPEGPRLVIVDGRYDAERSILGDDSGVVVTFGAAAGEFLPDGTDDGFAAANHAAAPGVTRVEVTASAQGATLHVVHLSIDALASHPRTELALAAGSSLQLIETFRSLPHPGLTNSVTTVELGDGARLDHLRVLETASGSAHVGRTDFTAHANSTVHSASLSAGPGAARHTVLAALVAPEAAVSLSGLSTPVGGAHHDTVVTVSHLSDGGKSRQQYVAIVPDHARASFTGQVVVASGTKGSDADQQNRNLLLGRTARADTRPWLQIDADDVSCTHGATVGRLDEDSLFYLRSRGIPERSARAMLIRAFAETTLDQEFPPGPGRDWLAASASAAIDAVLEGEVAATPSGKDSQ